MLLQDRRSQKEMTQNEVGKDTHGQQKARKKRETYGETMEMKIQLIGRERLINCVRLASPPPSNLGAILENILSTPKTK